MYYASGPPPERLRQLVALADAGLVRFIGEHTTVTGDDASGTFIATSTSHPERVRSAVLVDRARGVALGQPHDRSVARAICTNAATWSRKSCPTVTPGSATRARSSWPAPRLRVVRADGTDHPRRHALGVFTSRPAAGAFARPRTNAPAFRQNDAVARTILTSILTPPGPTQSASPAQISATAAPPARDTAPIADPDGARLPAQHRPARTP